MHSCSLTPSRLALTAVLAVLLVLPQGAAADMPEGFESDAIASGLTQPVNVAWTPDGRMFIAEKQGVLKAVPDGGGAPEVALDFRNDVNSGADRGFLGLAVDSSFADNGYLYLLYTAEADRMVRDDEFQPTYARLERVEIGPESDVVERTPILGTASPLDGQCVADNDNDCIPSDSTTHGIGTVISAPDGTLYVGVGDAAGYGEVDDNAFRTYDDESLAGKILHVDRDGRGLPGHSFCSANSDLADVCTKIHAKGFRNPFRFSLRPDGTLAVGDVGWNLWEELDLVTQPGTAWGWPCYEGTAKTPGYRDHDDCDAEYAKEGTPAAHRPPVYVYPHEPWGGAILAGPTYTGEAYPAEYQGAFFIGDYTSQWVKRVNVGAGGQVTVHDFISGQFALHLGAAPNGDLVYIDPGQFGPGQGSIHQVSYVPGNSTPVASADATPRSGSAPLTVEFDGSDSEDPDGDDLEFEWDFGDGESSTDTSPSHTYTEPGVYQATLTVSDGEGATDATSPIRIDVGNDPPVPEIEVPASWRAGDPVALSGSATDPQDGEISGEDLTWSVLLVHNEHDHPGPILTGSSPDFIAATDHDADSHYEVTLIATDSEGLAAGVTATIDPDTAQVQLESSPPGAPLSYAGRTLTAPALFPSTIGFRTSVSAAEEFSRQGREYRFSEWSDGGARLHTLTVLPQGLSLTAEYEPVPTEPPPGGDPGGGGDGNGGSSPGGGGGAGGGSPGAGSGSPGAGGGAPEAGGGAPGGDGDTAGPTLHFDPSNGFGARRGILVGRVSDRSGVARVEVALARRAAGSCRWWSPAVAGLARSASSCSRPRWMKSRLIRIQAGRYRWRLRLGAPPAPGAYVVRLRAFDATGNRSIQKTAVRAARP